MTTAPLETPIELFDIELEELLDDEAMCLAGDGPAVAYVELKCGSRGLVCATHMEAVRRWMAICAATSDGFGWCPDHRVLVRADLTVVRPV